MSDESPMTDRPLRSYLADLHVHTALSPCASEEMTPPAIVAAATAAGLDLIAISDHNAAGNIAAVQQAAEEAGDKLTVFPGVEITSSEEAHVLGVFPSLQAAEKATAMLHTSLPRTDPGYTLRFGEQPLLDARGQTVGEEGVTLAFASNLDLTATVELIHSLGGLAVAAHVDRKAFSVYSQLGFFPADAGFDGVEVSSHVPSDSPRLLEFAALGLPLVGSSDSHFLQEIGSSYTELRAAAPEFSELVSAFAGERGRAVIRA